MSSCPVLPFLFLLFLLHVEFHQRCTATQGPLGRFFFFSPVRVAVAMNVSREEERAMERQIADLRLSTLEALARESCTQTRQLDRRLRGVEEQLHILLQVSGAGQKDAPVDESHRAQHPNSKCDAESPREGRSLLVTHSHENGSDSHMCDYCFALSERSFACPQCGREWYCSETCQRLRQRCHASRCRACCSKEKDAVATV